MDQPRRFVDVLPAQCSQFAKPQTAVESERPRALIAFGQDTEHPGSVSGVCGVLSPAADRWEADAAAGVVHDVPELRRSPVQRLHGVHGVRDRARAELLAAQPLDEALEVGRGDVSEAAPAEIRQLVRPCS